MLLSQPMSTLRKASERLLAFNPIPLRVGRGDSITSLLPSYKDYTVHEHHHDFDEMVVIAEGMGVHNIDGKNYKVSCGDVFVIKHGHSHYFHKRENMVHLNFGYDFKGLPLPYDMLGRLDGFRALFDIEPKFRKDNYAVPSLHLSSSQLQHVMYLYRRMENEQNICIQGFEIILLSFFLELITFISRAYSKIGKGTGRQMLCLEKLIRRLESDYAEKISISEMCQTACMSKPTLIRYFKATTGMTPNKYLNSIRISKAEELILKGQNSMTEIAMMTGFSESNFFSRIFRKFKSISPTEYLKKNRN